MRLLLRVLAIGLGVVVLVAGVGSLWIFFYSRDLPDMQRLAEFAPAQMTQVSDPCLLAASVAIPYESIGNQLRAALRASEASEDDPAALTQELRGLNFQEKRHSATTSLQVARTMLCTPSRTMDREIMELRMAVQLERRFSRRELFTIFANRAWFGDGQVGVEDASRHFFQKEPEQLEVGEAALLAGLIRAPAYLSPFTHPDRALQRRNQVIDAMVEARTISARDGEAAKASPMGVETRRSQ
jgi:penicillin-binding protein 1A